MRDRLTCFATVSPARPGAVDELRRCAAAGLRGAGELNADAQGFDLAGTAIDDVAACVHRISGFRWCCTAASRSGTTTRERAPPLRIGSRPLRCVTPALQLVCAHLGGGLPFYAHMPEVAELCRRLWFDTAAGPYPVQAHRVPSGCRSLRRRPVAVRIGLSAAPREALHRRLRAGGSHRRGTRPGDGRERGAPAWSVTTCPSRYTSVSQHPRLRSSPLGHSLSGGETGARQPVLRLFRDQDWGLRPPSVVATDAPMRDRVHVEAGTSWAGFATAREPVRATERP